MGQVRINKGMVGVPPLPEESKISKAKLDWKNRKDARSILTGINSSLSNKDNRIL